MNEPMQGGDPPEAGPPADTRAMELARLLLGLAPAGSPEDAPDGQSADPEELAEVLWLAERVGPVDRSAVTPQVSPSDGTPPSDEPSGTSTSSDRKTPNWALYAATAGSAHEAGETAGHDENSPRRGQPVYAPRTTALTDPLAVMRSLRPLGRALPAAGPPGTELDEEQTVRDSLAHGFPLPVMRPARTHRLDLAIVIDTHPSMLFWLDVTGELCRALAQTGIFRDVRIWYLNVNGAPNGPSEPTITAVGGGERRSPQEIADPSGRRMVLVVSDTVADAWAGPALARTLGHWSAHGPVAVLNILPRRLWSRGAARAAGLVLRADRPAAPNTTWHTEPARTHSRKGRTLAEKIAIPVVEAQPASLGALAGLVAGDGRRHRLAALTVPRHPTPTPAAGPPTQAPGDGPAPIPPPTARDLLQHFRETASPMARELAGYFSAVTLTLPVMTLVRQAMLPDSDHGHLAELALGGLLWPWPGTDFRSDPDRIAFNFPPGVRSALLGGQLRPQVTVVQELVNRAVAAHLERTGDTSAGDFPATLADSNNSQAEPGTRAIAPGDLPFAMAPQEARAEEGQGEESDEADSSAAVPAATEMPRTGGRGPRSDVIVFTALGEEYEAVREHLQEPIFEYDVRGALFEFGTFAGRHTEWRVACHETGSGSAAAAALVERAVAAFQPRHIFFVGIAGGLKDTALGDVVAARYIYDYESGKHLEGGFEPRISTHLSTFGLVQRAQAVARADGWRDRIKRPFTDINPEAHVKPLAAGSRRLASERTDMARLLRRHCRDAVAVELDGYGFLQNAYVNAGIGALVVRGISDLLSDKGADNDRVWQPVASRNAAAFTFEVLHDLAISPSSQRRLGNRVQEMRRTRRTTGQSTIGFGPEHTAVVVSGDGSVERWDMNSGEALPGVPGGAELRLGHQAIVSPTRHSVAVARPRRLDLVHFAGRTGEHHSRSVPLLGDEFLVTSGGEVLATHDKRRLAVRSFDDGRILREVPCPAGLTTTSISANGSVVAMATTNRVLIHRENAQPVENRIRNQLEILKPGCWLAVSPSGRYVACASFRELIVWRTATDAVVMRREFSRQETFDGLGATGMRLVCTDEGRVLWLRRGRLSEVTDGLPEYLPLKQSRPYDDFAVHPGGELLAAVGSTELRVWAW
ncbi:SAV_2336 N-terminal domain-related protein [Streptomyces phaeochromogenes]|uniref:SAV_2336 N-terminal domain-related protein n=1 Tax=Streptomyces phaeochromogenes TaxID=1923 RepID=UPI003687DD09